MNEVLPGYDWAKGTRAEGMLRFGPILGYDFLKLAEDYDQNCKIWAVTDKAVVILADLPGSLPGEDDCVGLRLMALETAAHSDWNEDGATLKDLPEAFHRWADSRQNTFYEYGRTLRNGFGNMFTNINFTLTLLEQQHMLPNVISNPSEAVKIIRSAWFKELLVEMAEAPQGFWKVPDPKTDFYRLSEDYGRLKETTILLTSGIDLYDGMVFEQDDSGNPILNPAIKAVMKSFRRFGHENDGPQTRKNKEQTLGPATPWGSRTSSGCPVAHTHIGRNAIDNTFSETQIAELIDSGVIKRTAESYELYDFFGFAIDFVADHLETLNWKMDVANSKVLD